MTTLAQMHALGSIQDLSADLVRELIGKYTVRGKEIDPATEDPMKLVGRVDWLVNRVGRVLDVSGKLDAEKATIRIDRTPDNILHVRFVDLKGKTLYTLDLGDSNWKADGKDFEYVLRDADGNEVARGAKWTAISGFFAPEKEQAVKKAAAPKKAAKKTPAKTSTKKAKAGKAGKAGKAKAKAEVKSPVVTAAEPETEVASAPAPAEEEDDSLPIELG